MGLDVGHTLYEQNVLEMYELPVDAYYSVMAEMVQVKAMV